MQQIHTIKHLNIELLILRTTTALKVSVQSICKGVQLPADVEMERISQIPVFNDAVMTKKHAKETHCFMPVYLLSAWLLTIDTDQIPPEKLPILHKLQRSIQFAVWGHFFGVLCDPALREPGKDGDYKSRNFIYNCPQNAVREIQISTDSPTALAVETLRALSELFGESKCLGLQIN